MRDLLTDRLMSTSATYSCTHYIIIIQPGAWVSMTLPLAWPIQIGHRVICIDFFSHDSTHWVHHNSQIPYWIMTPTWATDHQCSTGWGTILRRLSLFFNHEIQIGFMTWPTLVIRPCLTWALAAWASISLPLASPMQYRLGYNIMTILAISLAMAHLIGFISTTTAFVESWLLPGR